MSKHKIKIIVITSICLNLLLGAVLAAALWQGPRPPRNAVPQVAHEMSSANGSAKVYVYKPSQTSPRPVRQVNRL